MRSLKFKILGAVRASTILHSDESDRVLWIRGPAVGSCASSTLGLEDAACPDATALWRFGVCAGASRGLDPTSCSSAVSSTGVPKAEIARGGQIIDASIVPVPKQRNSRDDNAKIKAGRGP